MSTRTIEQALAPYGAATCPRCLQPARVFVGRYQMICRQCFEVLKAEARLLRKH